MLQPSAITKIYIIIYYSVDGLLSNSNQERSSDQNVQDIYDLIGTPVAVNTLNNQSLLVPLHSNVPHQYSASTQYTSILKISIQISKDLGMSEKA